MIIALLKIEKMKIRLLLLFVFFTVLLDAQRNYVPNPSFEADTNAPAIHQYHWRRYADWKKDSLYVKAGNEHYLAKNWFEPTEGTPDYLNSKSSWLLGWRTKTARTGKGRMGIIGGLSKHSLVNWMLYKDTYAEYIECRLTQPLEAGKVYCVRYFVALDEKSNYACHRFGAVITRDCVIVNNFKHSLDGYNPNAQVIASDDHYITSDEGWVMICDTFIAKGGERFLMLGSYGGEFPKHVHKVKKTEHGSLRVAPFNKFAYYYIDDVSLMEVTPEQPMCVPPRDSSTSDHIVFMIDASSSMNLKGLLKEAQDAILPLAAALPPNDRITIIAYNDNSRIVADQIAASDTAGIRKSLENIKPGGGTNITIAFHDAYETIRKNEKPGAESKIIVLTDGKIFMTKNEKEKIIAASKNEGITVSVIFFGEEVPEEVSDFAENAGGHGKAVAGENTETVMRNEITAGKKDTPYGERNAGKIALWTLFTKVLLPGIVTAAVLRAINVI